MNSERDQLIEKMFQSALKEKISRLRRKHDHDLAFNIWVQIVKSGGFEVCRNQWMRATEITIEQALDYLDNYCASIEALIQEREEDT